MKKQLFKAIFLYIVAFISLSIGIIFLIPLGEEKEMIGLSIIHFIVGVVVILYAIIYLLRNLIKNYHGSAAVIGLVEFILFLTIGVLSILTGIIEDFPILKNNNACVILGLIFWVRGFVETLRLYFSQKEHNKYSFWMTILNVFLITIGTFLITKRYPDKYIVYITAAIFMILSIVVLVIGILNNVNYSRLKKATMSEEQTAQQETKEEDIKLLEESNEQ